jgi:hypothetical protein
MQDFKIRKFHKGKGYECASPEKEHRLFLRTSDRERQDAGIGR